MSGTVHYDTTHFLSEFFVRECIEFLLCDEVLEEPGEKCRVLEYRDNVDDECELFLLNE